MNFRGMTIALVVGMILDAIIVGGCVYVYRHYGPNCLLSLILGSAVFGIILAAFLVKYGNRK